MKKELKEFIPLWNLLKKEKKKLIFASILIILSEITYIFSGYLNGGAIEAITNLKVKEALLFLGIYFCLELFIDGIMYNYASSMIHELESKLSRKLGLSTYKKALDLPSYAYEKTSSGEVINRITSDADALSYTFEQLLSMVASVIGSFFLIFYVFYNSWLIGLEIISFMIILYIIINEYSPKLKEAQKDIKDNYDNFTTQVNESIRGIREIKTLGIKNNLISEMTSIVKDLFDKSKKEITLRRKYDITIRILKSMLEVGVFVTCVILLYYKQITLTFFVAMTYYVYRYMWLIENLNEFSKIYQRVVVSLSRVNEILENRLYTDETFGNRNLTKTKGILEFKDVTFAYPNEKEILKGFNLKIEPNKKIAIVGKSGQGKTTLFNLITRIFEPTKGEITIDGINIKDLTEESLRKNISIIRQEPFIFNRTIKNNFKIINKKINIKKIKEYSKLAYLDNYINSLPEKYDTKLGEGGVNLSGGQKQRLSIARGLAKESKIILFDEATSSLDNNSQKYIKKAIDNLVKDHTVVIIAHRLSTIIDADIIYVVDKGKVVASGTHSELLKTSKAYNKLYENESLNINE